ncbi:MAG TPA: ABC transporter permease subunit [Aggregatilineales bacterium]|nr:ABC transporter permease subunit [Aggregatilineales bacterium]
MAWAIFFETLRREWRTMLFWGIGIGAIAYFNVIAVPSVNGMQATAEAIAKMPPFILQMLGGGDLQFLASPAGFLNNQYYAIILVIFGIYAIIAGLNVTANEEDRGIMDVLLSLPVPRWRLVLEKFLAYSVLAAGVIVISTIALLLSVQMTPAVTVPTATLLEASFSILPGTLTMLALTVFIATLVRRKNLAAALASVFLIGSWFIDVIGRTVTTSFLNTARVISFYAYYDTEGVMQHGLSLGNILVPLAATAVLVVGALWAFQRRNISV